MAQSDLGAKRICFSILQPDAAPAKNIERAIIIEAPIAIEYNGIGYAVMMATPTDLDDFAIGFSLSEKLIDTAEQILGIDTHETEQGWIVRIQLPREKTETVFARARQRVSESSCGLCGMDNLAQVMRPLPPVTAELDVPNSAVFVALNTLRAHQYLNAETGAAHAAAFCAPDGSILMTREDVGRHNAMDKLIGALGTAKIPAATGFILLTARCSLELVQKAILANCPMLVTISAATDLAISIAEGHNLKLLSLARPDGVLVAKQQSD
jgi:FdhD protein